MDIKNILIKIREDLPRSAALFICLVIILIFKTRIRDIFLGYILYEMRELFNILVFLIGESIIFYLYFQSLQTKQYKNLEPEVTCNKNSIRIGLKTFALVTGVYLIFTVILENECSIFLAGHIWKLCPPALENNQFIQYVLFTLINIFDSILFLLSYLVVGIGIVRIINKPDHTLSHTLKEYISRPLVFFCLIIIILRTATYETVLFSTEWIWTNVNNASNLSTNTVTDIPIFALPGWINYADHINTIFDAFYIALLFSVLSASRTIRNATEGTEITGLKIEKIQGNTSKLKSDFIGYSVSPGIPWRRFFARMIDIQFGIGLFYMIFKLISTLILGNMTFYYKSTYLDIAAILIYLLIEPFIIKLTGTTLMKYVFGIKILSGNYDRNYTYRSLLKRNSMLFFKGLGLGIPIVSIFTGIAAYEHVKNDELGRAYWDIKCNTLVVYKKLTMINYLMLILLFAMVYILFLSRW